MEEMAFSRGIFAFLYPTIVYLFFLVSYCPVVLLSLFVRLKLNNILFNGLSKLCTSSHFLKCASMLNVCTKHFSTRAMSLTQACEFIECLRA